MYCPSCGSEYRLGYQECVDCKVPLVEHLPRNVPGHRVPKFPTIPKPPDNRPLLLKVVPYLAFIVGGVPILCLLLALFDVGTYTWAGNVISGNEFFSEAALPIGALALVSFAVAFAFWREALWSRDLLIACLAVEQLWFGTGGTEWLVGPFTFDLGILSGPIVLGFAGWYLYVKPRVRTYYQELRSAAGSAAVHGQPPNSGPAPGS